MRRGRGPLHAERVQADPDTRSARAPASGRRLGAGLLWSLALLATALNGVVVGYGVLWLQLFGERPDAADHRVSAAAYVTSAAVLAIALPALLESRTPRWLVPTAVVVAALLGLLSLTSAVTSLEAEPHPLGRDDPWGDVLDGVGGVLWAPWTWVLLVLGVRALVRAGRRRLSDAR